MDKSLWWIFLYTFAHQYLHRSTWMFSLSAPAKEYQMGFAAKFCACENGDKDNSSGGKFDSSIPLDDNELPIIPAQ